MYIYELPDWPRFDWDRERLAEPVADVRYRQGRLIGHMEALGFELRQEAVLKTLTADVLKSSEIEGERLDMEQVRRMMGTQRLFGMGDQGLGFVAVVGLGLFALGLILTRRRSRTG